jgi:hypothetical protein
MAAVVVLMPVRMERRRRRRRRRGDTGKTRTGNPRVGGHKKETTEKTVTEM